jgi:hypothetical protein
MARQQAEDAERDDGDGERSGCPGRAGADRPDSEFAHYCAVAGEVAIIDSKGSSTMALRCQTMPL